MSYIPRNMDPLGSLHENSPDRKHHNIVAKAYSVRMLNLCGGGFFARTTCIQGWGRTKMGEGAFTLYLAGSYVCIREGLSTQMQVKGCVFGKESIQCRSEFVCEAYAIGGYWN